MGLNCDRSEEGAKASTGNNLRRDKGRDNTVTGEGDETSSDLPY